MNPLTLKLEHFVRMSVEDRAALDTIAAERPTRYGPREDIVREGERPRNVSLLLSGWACRYKELEDGRRQIVAFFLPGDLCDLNVYILQEMDHSMAAMTAVTIAELPHGVLEDVTLRHPRIAQALWWEALVNIAIQREWTVSLGQRTAFERLAHLLCELFLRLRTVGLAPGPTCDMPLTQVDLADATGLSAVHANRTLQELRAAGLIVLKGRQLTVPDLDALKRAALFNANYLHLGREGRNLDANRP